MLWGCRFSIRVPVITYMEWLQIRCATSIATYHDWVRMHVTALTLCWYCACEITVCSGTSIITLLLAVNINAELLPSHHCLSMAAMWLLIQRLREEIRWLIIRSDVMYTDLLLFNVIPEMVELNVKVFRWRSVFVDSSHLQSSAIVFEHTIVYSCLRCRYRISLFLHLLE